MMRRLACNVASALCRPSTSGRSAAVQQNGPNTSLLLACAHHQPPSSHASDVLAQPPRHWPGSLGGRGLMQAAWARPPALQLPRASASASSSSSCSTTSSPCSSSMAPGCHQQQQQQRRGLFGAAREPVNHQVHTHDAYKFKTSQPTYDWMVGRFVMDRNGVVWHKQANRASKRYHKNRGTLQRLKRWKALQNAEAAKFRKLAGVRERLRYWAPPDPSSVPGFGGDTPYRPPPRLKVKADRRPGVGDPALRQH